MERIGYLPPMSEPLCRFQKFLSNPLCSSCNRWQGVVGVIGILAGCAGTPVVDTAPSFSSHINQTADFKSQAGSAFQAHHFDEAAQSFTLQARVGGIDEHKAWFNAGASYWNAGKKREALEAYEQAVAVNPMYSKGHIRLTNKYASLGRVELSAKHKKHAKAIQQVAKLMSPHWDKANQLRGRGADYDYAAATIHDTCAKYYEEQGLSELAEAERKLADRSRMEGQLAKAKAGAGDRQARTDAEDRAFRTEVLGTLKDMTATATKVNPASPFTLNSGGSSEAKSAVMGLGAVEQSFGAYANTMQMFEGKLQAQREEIKQQGQQAQIALADPKQAQLQRNAQQRTLELQKRLEDMEQQAMAYLVQEGILDEPELTGDHDTLDLQ